MNCNMFSWHLESSPASFRSILTELTCYYYNVVGATDGSIAQLVHLGDALDMQWQWQWTSERSQQSCHTLRCPYRTEENQNMVTEAESTALHAAGDAKKI